MTKKTLIIILFILIFFIVVILGLLGYLFFRNKTVIDINNEIINDQEISNQDDNNSKKCISEGSTLCDVMGCGSCCKSLIPRYYKEPMKNKAGEIVCIEEMTTEICVNCGDGICGIKENWCVCSEDCSEPSLEDLDLYPY